VFSQFANKNLKVNFIPTKTYKKKEVGKNDAQLKDDDKEIRLER